MNFQELVDLRYTLYHRCSRAGFTVKRWDKDDFKLTGRSSSFCEQQGSAFPFVAASNIGWRAGMAWGFASES